MLRNQQKWTSDAILKHSLLPSRYKDTNVREFDQQYGFIHNQWPAIWRCIRTNSKLTFFCPVHRFNIRRYARSIGIEMCIRSYSFLISPQLTEGAKYADIVFALFVKVKVIKRYNKDNTKAIYCFICLF